MLDVAVIGGGPIGSWIAFRLAKYGFKVVVLEKNRKIGQKLCCTGIISQECVSKYDIAPNLIFHRANSARIFSHSGLSLYLKKEKTQACIINRQAFDLALAEKSQDQGVEYRFNAGAENILIKSDGIVVEVGENGKTSPLKAKAVVLATGFNAPLVKKLGLGQPGYLVAGAQTEVDLKKVDEVEIYLDQELAPGFFAWLVPASKGKGLAGLLTRHSPGAHLRKWMALLESQGKIAWDNSKVHFGGIPLKPLDKTYGNRLLVVGDAAGQVKPTTGGGIYFGLLCADIAADTLHHAFEAGDLSAKRLSQYEQDWRNRIGHELKIEYLARRLYERLGNKQIEKLFSTLNSTGIVNSLLTDESLSFDWHGGLLLKALKLGTLSQVRRFLPSVRKDSSKATF